MKVVFFHRKPRVNANFSVEILFREVRKSLPVEIEWTVKELRYYSNGFFKRFYIGVQAALNQQDINHITGDINFIALFLKKKRTVLTFLDLGLMNHPKRLSRFLLKLFWVVLPAKRSAVITTISESTKTELLKYVNINPSKIKVIYVPVSDHFKPHVKKFNSDNPVILQIGTKPNKNVKRLVQALEGIPCRLEIIGEVDQDLVDQLIRSNIKYNCSKNLSNEQVFMKYLGADILAFVSTYEGFGMPIVEANTVGRVVITSNILSMPEVAGDAAHLVNPYEVLSIKEGVMKVIEDTRYREQLIENGFRNGMRFNVNEIARKYTDIYKMISNNNYE